MMKRLFVVGMLAGVAVLSGVAAGCGGDSTGPTTMSEVAGTYNLSTVDGDALPATITQGGLSAQITAGFFKFNADGTLSASLTVAAAGNQVAAPFSGTYTLSGSTASMSLSTSVLGGASGASSGTFSGGDTFTWKDSGFTLVYKK
jgi:hypothetical protein